MKPLVMPSVLETTLEKVGRSLADRFGIRVVCQGDECCTDGRTIYLPGLPDELPESIVRVIQGYLDHEASHIAAKSNFRIAKWFKDNYGPGGFTFLNILEDLRVEEYMRQSFPGSRHNLDAVYHHLTEEATKKADPIPPWLQLAFGASSRGTNRPDLPFVGADVYQILDQIHDVISAAPQCLNTKGVARLAVKAWPIVEPLFSVVQNRQPGQPGQKAGKVGQLQGGPLPTEQGSATSAPFTTGDAGGVDIMKDLAKSIADMVRTYARANQVYRVWDTSFDTVHTASATSRLSHHERMTRLLPHVAGVRQKLLQTLLAEPKARWLGDKEAGRIHPRALYRLSPSLPRTDGNNRVFRERIRTKRLHTAATLLVDQSSSMDGDRIKLAADTALVFCEALSRLNIPCCVIGFSTADASPCRQGVMAKAGVDYAQITRSFRIAPLRHTYFKHFNESFRSVSGRFDGMRTTSMTPLGESILFAARELALRREERKVLFVITDGRPGVGLGDDSATFEHAKTSVKRVERAGIDVALVGIKSECVHALHHRSVDIKVIDDLPKTVMRQLHSLLANNSTDQYRFLY